jgi:hypothetical protein
MRTTRLNLTKLRDTVAEYFKDHFDHIDFETSDDYMVTIFCGTRNNKRYTAKLYQADWDAFFEAKQGHHQLENLMDGFVRMEPQENVPENAN